MKRFADSRCEFVDGLADRFEASHYSLAASERSLEHHDSLLAAKSEHKELQPEKQEPGSCFSKPAFAMNSCLQNLSAATGDFTGKFDGIITSNAPDRKDVNYDCSFVGEGDVLLKKYWQNDGVSAFGWDSLRGIWPDGDADHKSDERCGLKEENNNVLESSSWLPESGFLWPVSRDVALGNSIQIWLNSDPSFAPSTVCENAKSDLKSCGKTMLHENACDEDILVSSNYNTAGYAFDLCASSANICDKVTTAATVCSETSAASVRSRPSSPVIFPTQSALTANSLSESFSTANICRNWPCADLAETVTTASSTIPPSTSALRCLSLSISTPDKLLSSGEGSSSGGSFQSALHEEYCTLWLNTSSTHSHESGPLCAIETSSDSGSQFSGSDSNALHSLDSHYEADISSGESSVDEGSSRNKASIVHLADPLQESAAGNEHSPSNAHVLFGFSCGLPSESCSFSPVGIEDIISMSHSKFQSSETSANSSDATKTETSESDVSQPYSAACDSVGEDDVIIEEFQGLLLDWDQPHEEEKYEWPTADCGQTDSEDQEEPACRNLPGYNSDNFKRTMPTWHINLPDSENLAGSLFNCDQQEVSDLAKFEKLKSIWDETQSDSLKGLTSGDDPQATESENFEGASFCGAFCQHDLEDFRRQSPCPEQAVSENYRKLSFLWEKNQPKVENVKGVTAVLENDCESMRGVAPRLNRKKVEPECRSGMMPAWNMVHHPQENSKVLNIGWNQEELQTDNAEAMVLNWNTAHEPNTESFMGLTSHLGEQEGRVENMKGLILGCETVRSSCENLKEPTDDQNTVGDNFEELKSIWEEKQSLKSLKRGNWQIKQIQEENSIALTLDNNRQESDSENLKNLAKIKSIWEEKEPHSSSLNDLKLNRDLIQTGVERGVGSTSCCDQQSAELGSLKNLAALKSIWEEKHPKFENLKEVQQTWDVNQCKADDLFEIASSCNHQEAASVNLQNLAELKFIWEDTPQKSENLKDMTCRKSDSVTSKKLIPDLDNSQLNAENLLELGTKSCNQTAALENSKNTRFTWQIDEPKYENPSGVKSNLDQYELDTENIVTPVNSFHCETSDSENYMLLMSIWEGNQSETVHLSGRASGWEVPESRSENSKELMLTFETDQTVVLESARNVVGDVQNLTQLKSLWEGKQMNSEILMGANWDMNSNDVEPGMDLSYNCNSQGNDAGPFPDLTQLKSLWEEKQNDSETLRGANPSWAVEQSETENSTKLDLNQGHQDAGSENFQNLMQLKVIWDEKESNFENLKGSKYNWDMNETETLYTQYSLGSTSDQSWQKVDIGNFQNLTQLKSIWEEKEPDSGCSKEAKLTWDTNRVEMDSEKMELPSDLVHQGGDHGNFLNLNEMKSVWEEEQRISENHEQLASCWEKQASELEIMAWDANLLDSENLIPLNSGTSQQEIDSKNLKDVKSLWEGQKPGTENVKGPSSCWKPQGVELEILNTELSNWNTSQANSETFGHSLFNVNCQKADSDNFETVRRVRLHGDIRQSNSEIFLDEKLADTKCFKRPVSDRDLRYLEFGGHTSHVDLWQSDSDELKQLISSWDKQQAESRGIRGLFSRFDLQQPNLAAEWQLAEVVSQLQNSDDASASLWRLAGKNQDLPKLVPSENSAFQDEIPHRFLYQYAFFNPKDAHHCDHAVKDARTETIRHIYEPSNSIVRQLEDIFDDGQRLFTEEALTSRPNCVFRPIGERNSGLDSYHSAAASVGIATDVSDLSLQIKTPVTDPPEVVEPSSPYQLYLGVESQTFVPRFRVHKELEKSAQTGEASPPMQNNECVFGMNVILSTIALLD